jgi:hypothetical protein
MTPSQLLKETRINPFLNSNIIKVINKSTASASKDQFTE